jgi:hypothetical protein
MSPIFKELFMLCSLKSGHLATVVCTEHGPDNTVDGLNLGAGGAEVYGL